MSRKQRSGLFASILGRMLVPPPLPTRSDILSPLFCRSFSEACSATKNLSQKCQCASQRITSQSLLEDAFREGTYNKMDPGGVYRGFSLFFDLKVFLNLSCTQSELLTSCLSRLWRRQRRYHPSSFLIGHSGPGKPAGGLTDPSPEDHPGHDRAGPTFLSPESAGLSDASVATSVSCRPHMGCAAAASHHLASEITEVPE